VFVTINKGYVYFGAAQYLNALRDYSEGLSGGEDLDDVLEYIQVQMEAGKAKQQYVRLHGTLYEAQGGVTHHHRDLETDQQKCAEGDQGGTTVPLRAEQRENEDGVPSPE